MTRIGSRAALELRDAIAGTVPRARADGVAAGTVTAAGTETWVLLDGADSPTPMQAATCSAARGDRVSVRIRDGVATVTGNLTRPAQTAADVTAAVSPVATRVADVAGQVDGVAGDVARLRSLVADSATIGDLEAVTARVTALQAAKADVTDLEATNATVADLRAKKADVDLANVNNAWIANGTIKDAAISDAQILGVSANKLTAGTIDASRVNVTNLNADNITVGTINGKRIGSGSIDLDKLSQEVPTKEQLDKAKEELQGQIDGNIETFTVSTVPTLNNEPAKAWTDAATRKKHVGDVAYVVNKSSQQDGYAYRFGYDETAKAYGWTLIKDNDVTAALKRISEAEGSIDGLKTFETSTSKWMDETDEGLTQVRSRTTTLETQMGDKVSTTTFKELSDTVDGQASTITTMSDTLSKKADGSTVTSLSQTVSQVKQTADGNSTKLSSLSKTVETKADSSTVTTVSNKLSTLEQTVDGTVESIGSLTETVSKKADSSTVSTLTDTVNTVKKTADTNASSISSLSKTVDTKADGSAVTTLANRVTTAEQSLDGFKSTVSTTYETKADATSKRSALETSISQTNDAVALKAAKTDLDAATKRITAAETSIKANSDQITLKASKTEVPGLVDVGGRNLLRDTGDIYPKFSMTKSSGYETSIEPTTYCGNGGVILTITKVDSSTSRWLIPLYPIVKDGVFELIEPGETYIASMDLCSSVATSVSVFLCDPNGLQSLESSHQYVPVSESVDGSWTHIEVLLPIREEIKKSNQYFYLVGFNKIGVYKLANFKLEKGNVSTAWTPAPEDVQADISTAKQAAIDVSAKAIKSFVKSAGGETSYKQTDSGFTWTTTSPMTQVADSTARTNASNAATAASNAATAASSAKAAASKAQDTADAAAKTASSAAKTATDFLSYGADGLTVGKRDAAGSVTGTRAVLGSEALEFRAADGTVLSSFGAGTIDLGSDSASEISLMEDSSISSSKVRNYLDEEVTALSLSSGSVEVSSTDTTRLAAAGTRPKAAAGYPLDGYTSELVLSGLVGDDDDGTSDGSFRLRTVTEVDAASPNATSQALSEIYANVNTNEGVPYMVISNELFHTSTNGKSVEDAVARMTFDPGDEGVGIHSDAGVSIASNDLVGITHTTSGRPPLGVGFGAGGDNRGLSAEVSGSDNDGFAWLLAVSDSQHWPIVPGLYHADVGNCSLIPVYTGYVTHSSLASGSSKSGTVSLSHAGYAPIGVIGTDVSQSSYPAHVLANSWVTDRKNGSGTLHYTIKNTTSSSANTCKVRWHVLWARQTDINGTYVS